MNMLLQSASDFFHYCGLGFVGKAVNGDENIRVPKNLFQYLRHPFPLQFVQATANSVKDGQRNSTVIKVTFLKSVGICFKKIYKEDTNLGIDILVIPFNTQ